MKKIVYLLTLVISVNIFSFLFLEKNNEDISTLLSFSYSYIEKETGYQGCKVWISLENLEKNEEFLKELLKLAKDNNYVVTSYQEINMSDNSINHISYIYEKDGKIKESFLKLFGKDNCENINELSTKNHLSLINHLFLGNDIYTIKNFDNFNNEIATVNDIIAYNVYGEDKEVVKQQILDIAKNIINVEMDESWEYQENNENTLFILFMLICFICFIISIIHVFLHNKKEIGIVKLLGYSYYDILKKYLFNLLGNIYCIFIFSHVFFSVVCIECMTGNTVEFLKKLVTIDIIFFVMLFLFSLIVFFSIIKKINLKKINNYGSLLKSIYFLKIICLFIFCFIFSFTFYQNKTIINETINLLECYDLCDDFYKINNLVGDMRGNQAIERLLKEEMVLALNEDCLEQTEIPFIVANENYVHLFNDDDAIKENMLIVPSKYKEIDLKHYKLKNDVEIKYVDYSCTYDGLSISLGLSYKDPIVFVINDSYFGTWDILLSKDKSIEEYQKLVSPYIEDYELRLEDANRFVEQMLIYSTLPACVEIIFYFSLFIFSFIMIIYIFMKIYFEQYNKEIAVKNTLGYRFIEIYYPIYVIHMMAYILPMILVGFMLQDIQGLSIFFVMTFSFDFIVQTILLNINHRKSKLVLLKDGE